MQAFHDLAARCPAVMADWWTHDRAARALAISRPDVDDEVRQLAQLYEQARYQSEDSALTDEQLAAAKDRLAAVPKVMTRALLASCSNAAFAVSKYVSILLTICLMIFWRRRKTCCCSGLRSLRAAWAAPARWSSFSSRSGKATRMAIWISALSSAARTEGSVFGP